MDAARREWVEGLVGACDRALVLLAERDDANVGLVADLNDLRARLRAELADAASGFLS